MFESYSKHGYLTAFFCVVPSCFVYIEALHGVDLSSKESCHMPNKLRNIRCLWWPRSCGLQRNGVSNLSACRTFVTPALFISATRRDCIQVVLQLGLFLDSVSCKTIGLLLFRLTSLGFFIFLVRR